MAVHERAALVFEARYFERGGFDRLVDEDRGLSFEYKSLGPEHHEYWLTAPDGLVRMTYEDQRLALDGELFRQTVVGSVWFEDTNGNSRQATEQERSRANSLIEEALLVQQDLLRREGEPLQVVFSRPEPWPRPTFEASSYSVSPQPSRWHPLEHMSLRLAIVFALIAASLALAFFINH